MNVQISFHIPAENGGYNVRHIDITDALVFHCGRDYADVRINDKSCWTVFSSDYLPASPRFGETFDVNNFDNIVFLKSSIPGCRILRVNDFAYINVR